MALSLNQARMGAVKPSATLEMSRRAGELKRQGVDVTNLSAGEPEERTPECILEVAHKAVDDGLYHHYTPARGLPELVDAMRAKLARDQKVAYGADEVIATIGTKGGLSLAFDALIGEGDEVIIFAPYWVTYPDLVRLAGGTPVIVETRLEDGYRPTVEQLRAALTPRTKAVVLNSPNNPTGAGIDERGLRALMAVLEGTDVWVLSDEIYGKLVYGGFEHVSPAALSDDARARTVVFDGVAKAYAMTGWRLGVAAGPKAVIDAMLLLQQQRISCPTGVAQAAAAYALHEPPEVKAAVATMHAGFERRRKLMLERLSAIEGARVHAPEGAFYCFCDLSSRIPGTKGGELIGDDVTLATRLLTEAHVAVVPGTPFGAPGAIRVSYAASEPTLEKGLSRIADFVKDIG